MGYYKQCYDCGKYVNVAKPIFGSLHICLTDEELRQRRVMRQGQLYMNMQQSCTAGQALRSIAAALEVKKEDSGLDSQEKENG